jgi:hypothetical protein
LAKGTLPPAGGAFSGSSLTSPLNQDWSLGDSLSPLSSLTNPLSQERGLPRGESSRTRPASQEAWGPGVSDLSSLSKPFSQELCPGSGSSGDRIRPAVHKLRVASLLLVGAGLIRMSLSMAGSDQRR